MQYVPRNTQDSDVLALVREHWPAFRDRLEERAGCLPAFVRDELEALLTCGDFEHGFLVAQCQRCGDSLRVPFACKSRGICPSCMGRRMAETAALLVEHRLPAVPWRLWVLSFSGPLAVRLGKGRALLGRVCQRFANRVIQTLRRLTKRAHGLTSSAREATMPQRRDLLLARGRHLMQAAESSLWVERDRALLRERWEAARAAARAVPRSGAQGHAPGVSFLS